jgi:hypothetical protein
MILKFDGQEFLDKFNPRYKKLSNCVKTVILPDGRVAQMQIIITTDENDFCTKVDTMNAVVHKLS